MSPWGFVSAEMQSYRGKEEMTVDIKGIAILDYLALYKKFTYIKQESYSLKYVASEELGHTKVDLPGDTFNDNIDHHWNDFVHYNIVDTQLVTELEAKLKLLELIITMAYQAKINFTDVFSPGKMWDALIHNSLLRDKIVVPQRGHTGSRNIDGAYVKEPLTGKYNWIVSLDATSLYPSIMMSLNISPETFAGRVDIDMDSLLKDSSITSPYVESGAAISPIGAMFTKEKIGILPRLIKEMMAARKTAKSQMLGLESEYEKSKDESLLPKISALNNAQMAAKIALNSLYGSTANEGFRFFNPDVAESITITGQYILKKIELALDIALNKKFNTGEHKYLVYVDTDSVYVNMKPVVDKFLSDKSTADIVKSLEKVAQDILQAEINKICGEVADTLGFFENKIHFKLEAVGDTAIWCAKKKYIVRVHSSEGVTYAKPKFKVMGLEMVRSSTPSFIRGKLRESLEQVFDGTEKTVQLFISEAREEFNKLPISAIAFPRTANSIDDYADTNSIYKKATPIHVRGVLLYNEIVKRKKLQSKYPLINDGDKIKFMYLIMPNPLKENIIAIPADGILPPDLGLHEYVDYEMQFQKSFINAMDIVLQPIGWTAEETSSLESFFG
jgi:DNA polymerase elongation subunit (family B)